MDDDIVFLGSSPATATLPHSRPAQRPVTGVSLHVDKNGPIDAHVLSFRRAAGTVVHIGRRSALDPEPDDSATAAMFRCAVVSRRHAKIAFADSGHAYLIDLRSHHGTHVRSAADRLARALTPETPTLLVDGDVITFGKAVGKGDECVRPIVVRVALLHDNNTTHDKTPSRAEAQALPTASPASSKASSGRYGIRTSASSSSSDAENDGYSDIEEIPPPLGANTPQEQEQAPAPPSQTSFGNYPLPFKFKHITALKRFLPPMHVIPQDAPWHALEDRPHASPVYRQPQPGAPATNYPSQHFHPTSAELRLPPPAPHTHSMPTFVERPLAHLSGLSQFFFSGRGAGQPSNAADSNNAQCGNAPADSNMENAPDEPPSMNPAAEAGNTAAPLPAMTSPPPLLPAVEISDVYKRFMSQREPSYPDLDNMYYDDALPKLAASDDSLDHPYSPTRDWTLGLQPWDTVFPPHRAKSSDGAGQRVVAVPAGGVPLPVAAVAHLSSALSSSSSDADADSDWESASDFSAASSRNSARALRERARDKERGGPERGGRERGGERATSEPMELASSRSASVAPAAPRAAAKGKGRAVVVDADEGGEADMDIENDVDAPVELDALRRRAEKTSQTVIRRIEEAVARLQADLTMHRGQTKATLARHMNQMDSFDGRIREVDAECGVLCLRVETLGERLGVVEMDVASNTEASFNALEAEAEKERASEDMRLEGVHAVQALIAEAQEELRALKALRAEAEATAAAARQQQQVQEHEQVRRTVYTHTAGPDADDGAPQPPVLPSLKRKRDDSDEDADADEAARGSEHAPPVLVVSTTSTAEPSEEEELAELVALEKALAMQSSARDRSIGSGMNVCGSWTPPPPRKRARRVAGLMARTATAVGVGAVVTWTALAFS